MPRTVLVSGYFGHGNRGDDLLLDALAGHLRTAGFEVVVASTAAPGAVEATNSLPSFSRLDPYACDTWAARADAVIVGPGGLWHDYSIEQAGGVAGVLTGATVSPSHLLQLPLLVVAHGGEFHGFGLGVGPLAHPAARDALRLTGRIATSVTVRDQGSADLLAGIEGFAAPVRIAPDLVYALPLPTVSAPADAGGYVVVNARPWEGSDAGPLLDAVAERARARGLTVVGLPMQRADERTLRAWAEADGGSDIRIESTSLPWPDFVATLAGARAVVAMRLHTSLLAHRLGVPAVGLAYDDKVAAQFATVGCAEYALAWPPDPGRVAALVDATLNGAGRPDPARIAALEAEATEAVTAFAAGIAARPGPTHDPAAVPGRQGLSVADGTVTTGNEDDPERRPQHTQAGDRLHLVRAAHGDHLHWTLTLPTTPGKGHRVSLRLRSLAKEWWGKRDVAVYRVALDGLTVAEQDVATWAETNDIWIAWTASATTAVITVELAVTGTPPEDVWSQSIGVAVTDVRLAPGPPVRHMLTSMSSPRGRLTPTKGEA